MCKRMEKLLNQERVFRKKTIVLQLIQTGQLPSVPYGILTTVVPVPDGNRPVSERVFLSSKEPSRIPVKFLRCYTVERCVGF